jgi:UDP-N-acetylmuramoyl-L-alanyl-D-glutamate--2,6-diaminopimelate ligase
VLRTVPGRMEQVDAGQPFTVIVDYAHTPDALANVLVAARQIARGRVVAVFGATGDRDAAKRPLMGEAVGRAADVVFLTDDETYTEDPEAIRAAVRPGLKKAKSTFTEIADRKQAIAAAFKAAKKGDVVVLAGLGHQDTRNMGGKLVKWDERQIARQLLRR